MKAFIFMCVEFIQLIAQNSTKHAEWNNNNNNNKNNNNMTDSGFTERES